MNENKGIFTRNTNLKKKKKTMGHLTIPSDGETKETDTLTS